jgi:hypothetical protein
MIDMDGHAIYRFENKDYIVLDNIKVFYSISPMGIGGVEEVLERLCSKRGKQPILILSSPKTFEKIKIIFTEIYPFINGYRDNSGFEKKEQKKHPNVIYYLNKYTSGSNQIIDWKIDKSIGEFTNLVLAEK